MLELDVDELAYVAYIVVKYYLNLSIFEIAD